MKVAFYGLSDSNSIFREPEEDAFIFGTWVEADRKTNLI